MPLNYMIEFLHTLPDRFQAFGKWLLISVLLVYTSWRLWAFTIKPALHPKEPKELPYWIPRIGHGKEYVKNGQQIITRAREYFRDTREPFALTVNGRKLYFLTSRHDVSAMYKNTTSLDFEVVVRQLAKDFGMTKDGADRMLDTPHTLSEDVVDKVLRLNETKPKSVHHRNEDTYRLQLHPGPQYDLLEAKMVSLFDKKMHVSKMDLSSVSSPDMRTTDGSTPIFLYKWTQRLMITVVSEALYGKLLLQQDSKLLDNFLIFEKTNWKLWYRWPHADDVRVAKAGYVSAIEKFFQIPFEERAHDMSDMIKNMEKLQDAVGNSLGDSAHHAAMIYWVSNTNAPRLTFWVMCNLLYDSELLKRVQEETSMALQNPQSRLDVSVLTNSCPVLDAVINETLRMVSASASVRMVVSKDGYRIRDKIIPCGSRVIVPYQQLHRDESVWCPEPYEFRPKRFLKDGSLARSSSFRPFGGGSTYCPGRFIAKQEVRIFVTLALQRFEINVEPGQRMPQIDKGKPTTGLMAPMDGEDLLLRLKEIF